jgi:multicomponent Na+:H+ antiporter subunit E
MSRRRLIALVQRFVVFTVLWWILVEGDLAKPVLSLAIILAAAGASLALLPPSNPRWRARALVPLAGYFMLQSVLGGLDVARRALAPAMPIQPALVRFPLRLPAGFPTVLFAWLVSLTPGSASVHVEGTELTVHVLDERLPVERTLRALEARVAALV